MHGYRWYVKAKVLESACTYYRIIAPLQAAKDLDLSVYFHDDDPPRPTTNHRGEQSVYEGYLTRLTRAMSAANLHYCYFDQRKEWRDLVKTLREASAGDGEQSFVPAFFWGCDDNSEYCSPFNPAYARIGVRAPNGDKLPPGAQVNTIDSSGEPVVMWKDGNLYEEGIFDVERNWRMIESMYDNARTADGVIVSSPRLQLWYEVRGCENVHVYPNCLLPGTIPDISITKDPDVVKILWTGGASHFPDLVSIRPALGRIAKKYPQVRFIVMGQSFPWVWKEIPEEQVDFTPWGALSAYWLKIATMGHDINLCPLSPDPFNEFKTAIKWYESSLPHHPAATLAARWGAFEEEIEDGVTGLLYDPGSAEDFEEKLSQLIEEETYRKQIAADAKVWVKANRETTKHVPDLMRWVRETYADVQRRHGKEPPK